MIDICVNFSNRRLNKNVKKVILNAKENGVKGIILNAVSLDSTRYSVNLAKEHQPFLMTTAGVHPHNAKELKKSDYEGLKKVCEKDVVVAVGECGLDYDRNLSSKEDQQNAFRMQLDIAREIGKPVLLHEREAVEDFIAIMTEYSDLISKSVVHCFTGDKHTLRRYLDLGFMIGITGWVADNGRGKDLQEAIKDCPIERIMLETDAPHLKPKNMPFNGKNTPNEPKNLYYVALKIAELKGLTVEEVMNITEENTRKFFNL